MPRTYDQQDSLGSIERPSIPPCTGSSIQQRSYPKVDMVNKPTHYNSGKIECIEALDSATVNLQGIEAVCTANVIKYMWRWKQKNGTEDLKKAQWYLNKLIELQGEQDG